MPLFGTAVPSTLHAMTSIAHPVVIDLTVCISPTISHSACELDSRVWHCLKKDLYLYTSQQSAWLHVALADAEELTAEDLVVIDIKVGEQPPDSGSGSSWELRPCGIWILRSKFLDQSNQIITGVDVLFGKDAVDPRPQWTLTRSPLRLETQASIPDARLSVRRGISKPGRNGQAALRVGEDGTFKIVQISDTHMVTGVGVCNDAIDAHGNYLPVSEADPLTVRFIEKILDSEKPRLVILTGDQVHHDIADSQTALFKVVAPIIERSIPFAAVFGNHDSEGIHALSRTEQMSILQDLPLSLCEPGPEQVDGIGNFCLKILGPTPSQVPLSTLYFLDSHGQIPSKTSHPDYQSITQSQIDWLVNTSRAQRAQQDVHERSDGADHVHQSLAFMHIPLPEFGDSRLSIRSGLRREPTEGPSANSHLFDALAREGVSALGCGHDHVNDFCALLIDQSQQDGDKPPPPPQPGPWLCYGGASGFGGYCSYGTERYPRRMRVWQLHPRSGSLKTWLRVEHAIDPVNEILLVDRGKLLTI